MRKEDLAKSFRTHLFLEAFHRKCKNNPMVTNINQLRKRNFGDDNIEK
jgi:hypothetical protein